MKKSLIIFNVIYTLIAIVYTIIYGSAATTLPMPFFLAAGVFILIVWISVVDLWVTSRRISRR